MADDELIFIRGPQNATSASIVFRGPNTTMLDEMERAMHDAICAVARALESGFVVAGGGAVEVRPRKQRKEKELSLLTKNKTTTTKKTL